jgi:DNA polymerase (family 10)
MPLHNRDVAEILNTVADLLDIQEANPFRIRAYRNAARTVLDLSDSVADMVESGRGLSGLPGIGKDLAEKIEQIVRTGALPQLEELKQKVPPELRQLMQVAGLGPKRVSQLHKRLGVKNLEDLERAAREGRIRDIEGFGAKTEQKILQDVERVRKGASERRFLWIEMEEYALPLLTHLGKLHEVEQISAAGSYRRKMETVGDLDILVTCRDSRPVMDHFTSYDEVDHVVSRGETRSTVILRSGIQVDLRVVAAESYGAAMHYFTGSKAHNVAIRTMAVKRGLKINEYGVFRGEQRVAGGREEEVFAQVGLPYIEPELREDRGEIEAARQGRLPRLVTVEDIRGDLQTHTRATDGKFSIEEMAQAARERGYEYLAITDHSKRVTMARGLDAKRLAQQIEQIEKLNAGMKGFRILKSCEVDILEDGSLDLPDSILRELDFVLCSVHYNTNLSRERQTQRILKAMDNRYLNILAHPTGRLLGSREPYELDLEKVMEGARERGCYLEINADPQRLDLNDVHCRQAVQLGLKVPISTDAHSLDGLDHMRLGVSQARRGWLEAGDVLNTRSWPELQKLLQRP